MLLKSRKPAEREYIIKKSDRQAVQQFNALVGELNSQIERIKKEKDYDTLKDIVKRAHLLIYGD